MKVGQKFDFELFPEACCELCNDVIHNHFECPVCKNTYAGTTLYGAVEFDCYPLEFSCETCNASFGVKSSNSEMVLKEFDIKYDTTKQTKRETKV